MRRVLGNQVLLLALLWAPRAFAQGTAVDSPIVREGESSESPIWFPALAAAPGPDSPTIHRLPGKAQRSIDDFLRQGGRVDRGECIATGDVLGDDELQVLRSAGDFRAIVDLSTNVLVGEIVSIKHGFWFGTPSGLAEVKVTEALKRTGPFAASGSDRFYVAVPVSDFRVGKYRFCKTDSRWPQPPKKGDRVLAVLIYDPLVESPPIFGLNSLSVELFVEKDSGQVRIPFGLAERNALPPDQGFDALVERVRELVGGTRSPGRSQ